MRRALWISVAIVSCACIFWALLLAPSHINDYYRYGYSLSGALCFLAFVGSRSKRSNAGLFLLVIGSLAYLAFPARTFVRLLLCGEWRLLLQTITTAFQVPRMGGYSGAQAASWIADLLVFQLAFAIYFLALLFFVSFFAASRFLRGRAANDA